MALQPTLSPSVVLVTEDAVPPIQTPVGELPTDSALSPGAAAAAAGSAASAQKPILGILDFSDHSVKNLVFLGVVGYFAYKLARRKGLI